MEGGFRQFFIHLCVCVCVRKSTVHVCVCVRLQNNCVCMHACVHVCTYYNGSVLYLVSKAKVLLISGSQSLVTWHTSNYISSGVITKVKHLTPSECYV